MKTIKTKTPVEQIMHLTTTPAFFSLGLLVAALLPGQTQAANARPTLQALRNVVVNEDSGRQTIALAGISAGGADAGQTLTVEASSSNPGLIPHPDVIYTSPMTAGQLQFTPVADQFGKASITVVVRDDGDGMNAVTNTFQVIVHPVNDAPSFVFSSSRLALDDIKVVYVYPGFAQNILAGPANEIGQAIRFAAVSFDPDYFTHPPILNPDGTLILRVTGNVSGDTSVTFKMKDAGGTARGGENSSQQTLFLSIPGNPFYQVGGVYNGLFYETDEVRMESAGFVTFKVGISGAYSGSLTLGEERLSFAGRFNLEGFSAVTLTRPGNSPLSLSLQIDVAGGSDQVTGTVSNGEWTAVLLGDHAVYTRNHQAPQAGHHTVAFLHDDSEVMAKGSGYATLQVSKVGMASIAGMLPGNSQVMLRAIPVSKNGQIPFYLFSAAGQETVLGWLTLPVAQTGRIEGTVARFKSATGTGHYPLGLTNYLSVIGSDYDAIRGFGPDNGTAILEGGELTAPLVSSVQTGNRHQIQVLSGESASLRLNLRLNSGLVTGSFIHPVTGLLTEVKGVLLQQQGQVAGCFETTQQCGSFGILFDSKNDPRQQ